MLASVYSRVSSLVVHILLVSLYLFIVPAAARRLTNTPYTRLPGFAAVASQSSTEHGLTHSHTHTLTVLGVLSLVVAREFMASLVELWGSKLASLETPVNPDTIAAAKAKVNEITLKGMGTITKAVTPGAVNHRQEAILTIVGVLNGCELPPVKKHDISEHRLKYARQYAKVVGYDCETFAKALLNIQDIAYKFVTASPAGQMEPWMPDMASNDFGKFLKRTAEDRIPFAQYVDPAGVLGRFIREDVSHCLDNDVAYLELKNDKRSPKINLQIGDVNVNFIGHVADEAVNLLKAAFIKRHARSAGPSSKPPIRVITASNLIAKRRKFYEEENSDDDDIPEARKRNDMHISPTRGTDADEVMQ
ncbi:hypothetical protein B0H11DRAFT_2188526 [Mycena galericulata]|nr:hypothetical protein B0H11DRAFT_2188526 [Mycena galericulata]